MDLSPRPAESSKRRRRWLPIILLSLVGVGGIVIVTQFLTSAIDYYCNVDEIGVRSGCEKSTRLRVQGTVEQGSLQKTGGKTSFVMTFNDKSINVVYAGDPGGVFQECIAVVAHGRMIDETFESNRIEVKHSNEYVEKNAERFESSGSAACSQAQG
ncbi:MAG: cytochrome c maturation protein CcmE [Actinobacteria bacterium]|nr:cytochrome c maturation protein CcmE [Actinomycetota bacterium]